MKTKSLSLFFAFLFCFTVGYAQAHGELRKEHIEKRYTLYFRVNQSTVDPTYMGNDRTLETMSNDVRSTLELEGTVPGNLTVFASTSPEGPKTINEKLAKERANTTRQVLLDMFPQFDPSKVVTESRVDDWSGVVLAFRRDTTLRFRDVILKILGNPAIENKDAALRKNPAVFSVLRGGLLDNMRSASIVISVLKTETNVDEYVVDPELYITSANPMEFTAKGGDSAAKYTQSEGAKAIPVVTCKETWVQNILPTSDSTTFSVAPNNSKYPRTAVVDVENQGKSYQITVNQAGLDPELTITSPAEITFPAEGGEATITFETNVPDGAEPVLRSTSPNVTIASVEDGKALISVAANESTEPVQSEVEIEYEGKVYTVKINQEGKKELKPFYMGIKTNMLYDLALVPNVGVEFALGKRVSVVGNWMYAWWKSDNVNWYWRTYGGDLALRWWFGKAAKEKPLQGHHIGPYGQIITYDFEVGNKGILADKWSWSAGLEYGYSWPITRRLNIDCTLGAGFHVGEFYEYLPIDGHYVWQATKRRQYIGPTKLEVSLVWLLGRGNENVGKGGKR